jgi:PAS domain S-box-containing protein
VLADLSTQALSGWYLPYLLEASARLVAETLGVELCGIFKLEESGEALRLVAGVGWQCDITGSATVGSGLESQAGYTVLQGIPVIVQDLPSEQRFKASDLILNLGVVSALSVPMAAAGFVFGVMSVHCRTSRDFSLDDARFLQTVANILSIAALRRQAVVALRQAHRALFETKEYLSNVIETSSDAIVSTNTEGHLVHCNTGVEKLLGYQREEVMGQPVAMLFECEDKADELVRLMREGGGSIEGKETTLQAKDGSPIPVLTSASIFYNETGQETGSVRFNRDLRDRNRWEEELTKVSEEIEKTQDALGQAQAEADAAGELRRVNEELNRYVESLQKAQEQLVQAEKMAALGRLTAGVTHEILNPLNVINLNLHVMLTDMDVPTEIAQIAKVLEHQVKRIGRIVEGLVDYSRGRETERHHFDLNELIERTLGIIMYDLMNRDITIVQGLGQSLPPVWADYDQVQQVVLNLLTNARQAMPDGGQLTLTTGMVQKNGQEFVELLIEDSGVGIASDHLDKLFDPFFTTKPEGEGTGMGLSICQGIVEAHGGSIQADSAEGRGSTFTIQLPLEDAEIPEDHSLPAVEPSA